LSRNSTKPANLSVVRFTSRQRYLALNIQPALHEPGTVVELTASRKMTLLQDCDRSPLAG
jgi:hypothetical protein